MSLIRRSGSDAKRDEAVMMLSALVGALSMARTVEDPELSDEIPAGTARALHRPDRQGRGWSLIATVGGFMLRTRASRVAS